MKSPQKLLRPDFSLEKAFLKSGYILGVDEVGRGCIAGSVVAAAVIFKTNDWNSSAEEMSAINDSKRVAPAQRERLSEWIKQNSLAYAVAEVSSEVVDKVNILQATFIAFRKVVEEIQKTKFLIDCILVDGNQRIPGVDLLQHTVVGGDSRSKSIAAASIVAKVHRDRMMTELSKAHPQYGFDKHKGYGTSAHWRALEEHGALSVHRRSFLKNFEKKKAGQGAEGMAADYLSKNGFQIVARNWRGPQSEIDIVAERDGELRFVEVRSRADDNLELSFPKLKQEKFKLAVREFLNSEPRVSKQSVHYDFIFVSAVEVQPHWDVFQW